MNTFLKRETGSSAQKWLKHGGHLRLPCTQDRTPFSNSKESIGSLCVITFAAEVNQAQSQNVDAIIVGTSTANDDVKAAAEAFNIPSLHCSGGAISGVLGRTFDMLKK